MAGSAYLQAVFSFEDHLRPVISIFNVITSQIDDFNALGNNIYRHI